MYSKWELALTNTNKSLDSIKPICMITVYVYEMSSGLYNQLTIFLEDPKNHM